MFTGSDADHVFDGEDADFAVTDLARVYGAANRLNNLVGYDSHRKVADVMKERLIKRIQQAGEDVPEIIDAPPKRGGQKVLDEEEIYQ